MHEMKDVRCVTLESGEDRWKVYLIAHFLEQDINVLIYGGDTPHIGAVALAIPRASLRDSEKKSASASVLCVTGHKEDQLARDTAIKLASISESVTCVSVGLHIDSASDKDIKMLVINYDKTVSDLLTIVEKEKHRRTV